MSNRAVSRFANSLLVVAAGLLVCGVSQAGPLDVNAMKVSSAGLNLRSDAGAQAMFKRLTVAAEQVCGGADAEFDALRTNVYRVCFKETLGNAVRVLNQPMVTHVYVAQYPSDAARYGIAEGSYVAGR